MEQNNTPQPPPFQRPDQPQPIQPTPSRSPLPMMGFMQAISTCLSKTLDFSSRARRSEFWWFVLLYFIVDQLISNGLVLSKVPMNIAMYSSPVVLVIAFLPLVSAQIRRLHDTGHSAIWAWIFGISMLCLQGSSLVLAISNPKFFNSLSDPFALTKMAPSFAANNAGLIGLISVSALLILVAGLILLIFSVQDSDPNPNAYGPSPKYPS